VSLQLDWLGLAEGAVFDGRKALSLIGINQNVVRIDKFPAQWQTSVVVIASENREDDSSTSSENDSSTSCSGSLSIVIRDPKETIVSSNTSKVVIERRDNDIPGAFVAVALVGLQLTMHGRYRITAELTQDAESVLPSTKHTDIFVVPESQ
jgi:hypothetical protein